MMDEVFPAREGWWEVRPVEGLQQGDLYWKVTRVYHLSPAENHGMHNVFVRAYDQAGNPQTGIAIHLKGYATDVYPETEIKDIGIVADIPIWKGELYNLEVSGPYPYPSEQVRGITTDHPDEPGPPAGMNTRYHHSFDIDFTLTAYGPPPPPDPQSAIQAFYAKYAEVTGEPVGDYDEATGVQEFANVLLHWTGEKVVAGPKEKIIAGLEEFKAQVRQGLAEIEAATQKLKDSVR